MPRSERLVATEGRPSSKVSIVLSCTPVPAGAASGMTAAPRTNAWASGTRPTNATPGCASRQIGRHVDRRSDAEIPPEMRHDLFQKPVEADAVRLPGPGTDQGGIVIDAARRRSSGLGAAGHERQRRRALIGRRRRAAARSSSARVKTKLARGRAVLPCLEQSAPRGGREGAGTRFCGRRILLGARRCSTLWATKIDGRSSKSSSKAPANCAEFRTYPSKGPARSIAARTVAVGDTRSLTEAKVRPRQHRLASANLLLRSGEALSVRTSTSPSTTVLCRVARRFAGPDEADER